ncbi:MAG: hypothetical protein CMM93_05950 [Rickettsiales bacterium]|nr:hypothetical protein [Rickettsiales bacterium]|tara:strand:- start:172 stop:846 length:675 start_codon:yes stop_codon:yes gene_type:complete
MVDQSNETVLALKGIQHAYDDVEVLQGVDLDIARGDIVALTGPSGSGKTTLLQIAGLLNRPQSGEVALLGETVQEKARQNIRRDTLGFVFQFHHLLPECDVLENVLMPIMIARGDMTAGRARAVDLLERVGLSHRIDHRPSELSGGERQRVALVRALIHRPALLLADEPTGNLDGEKSRAIWALLKELVLEEHCSVLLATHSDELANSAQRHVRLTGGRLETVR